MKSMKQVRRGQRLLILSIGVTAAVMALIVWFSGQSATESDGLSKGLAEHLMRIFPGLEGLFTVGKLNHYLRKLAHFTLYFILGCGLTGVASKQRKIPPFLAAVLIGTAFAATDEIHQFFSDSRGPMVQDVILDACGVAAGSALATLCRKCYHK